jgi:hypothetical protein
LWKYYWFFFGTFYALELRFIWRGHINLYLLGFAFTLRCVLFLFYFFELFFWILNSRFLF